MKKNSINLFINGSEIKSKNDFHKKIANLLSAEDFVDGYGYNLDALWDVMSSGAGLNCILHWKNSDVSKEILGNDYFDKVIEIFEDAEKYPWHQWEQYKFDSPFRFYLE